MRVRLFSDIDHVRTKADENNNVHVHCLLGLKDMTTYERVKPLTGRRYLLRTENALFILFCHRK